MDQSRDRIVLPARNVVREELADVGHSDDVVDVAAVDGYARMPVLYHDAPQLPDGGVLLAPDNLRTGSHDFTHEGVAKLDDRLDQLAVFLL